jgi:hypothetical protein
MTKVEDSLWSIFWAMPQSLPKRSCVLGVMFDTAFHRIQALSKVISAAGSGVISTLQLLAVSSIKVFRYIHGWYH